MSEPIFQTLGRYTIRAEIGRGGFATVYQALDASLNRAVALKVLHPQMSADRSFVERFRKEARTLASLRHPHIITVYEVSEVEGRLFIAMELAHGPSLAQAIADRKRFSWVDTLAVLKPISEALDYAHAQGVVHRDLKPANVLLDAERGPLLTDFGFARLLGDSSASMSLSGGILGTPAYIAPEVWELDTATPAADIYAVGCIAYEMLTGNVLFVGKTPMQSMRAHDRGPQFPTTWPADVPPGVEAALQVALVRQPESRYPKATTFWHALHDLEANAQGAREQAERQAVADQWKAEVAAAVAASEWSAARMAVGRWLSITPGDPQAQAARKEIERQLQLEGERQQKEEAERAAQAALTLAAARKAEEERKTKEEADRKTREEQQQQAELAAQAVAAEKAMQEAAEHERQRQAREAAKLAEEEARRKEPAASQQPAVANPVQRPQTETPRTETSAPAPQDKSNRTWLYVAGGVISLVVVAILFASTRFFAPAATPSAARATAVAAQRTAASTQAPALKPTEPPAAKPTEAPAVQQAAAGSKPYIPLISMGYQHQFWQAVKTGSEKAAQEFNVDTTFEGPETEAMVDKQVEMFQTALDKKPAAICLAAVDSKAFAPLLEKAKAAAIPVIGFDSGVDSGIPVATVATDNVTAAALAADKMAQLIGGKGEVAILVHDQTSRTGIDRVKGFADQIKAKYPNITIVDTQPGGGDQLKSTDIAKAVINAHPNLKGYFGANEGSIIGVLNAAKELNMGGKLVIIGYDSGTQQRDAIRSGLEAGAITQDPIGIGYKCVEAAVKAFRGEALPKTIDSGFYWYDKTNIDDPAIAAVLYD